MYKFLISLRYIRRRLITLFAIAGVALGVMVLVIVLSVMDGFKKEFISRLQGTLSHIVVSVRTAEQGYEYLQDKILQMPYVSACAPHINGLILIGTGRFYTGGMVIGIDYEKERAVGKMEQYLVDAYRQQKLWAEELLEDNVKNRYRKSLKWEVLAIKTVKDDGILPGGTHVVCQEIRTYIPNSNLPFDRTLPPTKKYVAYTIDRHGKIVLFEQRVDPSTIKNTDQQAPLAKWQEYFNHLANTLNSRNIVDYLKNFSPTLKYIRFVAPDFYFSEEHIGDWPLLAGEFKFAKKSLTRHLRKSFSKPTLRLLEEYKPDTTPDPALRSSLIYELNQALDRQGQGAYKNKLNRAFLEKTYASAINKNTGHYICVSINPDNPFYFDPAERFTEEEEIEDDEQVRPILIGYELMRQLQLRRGDEIALMTGKRKSQNDKLQAVSRKFVVTGAFKSGWQEIDARLVYAKRSDIQGFVDASNDVTEICVALDNFQYVDQVKSNLDIALNARNLFKVATKYQRDLATKTLGKDLREQFAVHHYPISEKSQVELQRENSEWQIYDPDSSRRFFVVKAQKTLNIYTPPPPFLKRFIVERWEDRRKTLLSAIRLERNVMAVILSLIVILAVVTIMIILILLVTEKTKDIGILKSMGATDKGVMAIFVTNGFFISFFGSIIGGCLGTWISLNVNWVADRLYESTGFRVFPRDVYYLDRIPVEVSAVNIGVIVGATLLLALLTCAVPAFKAAYMDAVEALNFETPSLNWRKRKVHKSSLELPASSTNFFGVRGIVREYVMGEKLRILHDVNLDVVEGEILVILGQSGVGKSTLLHIMGLLDTPTHGSVYLNKENLSLYSSDEQAKVRNHNIGFVFQLYHLLPEFTALENVLMGAMIRYGLIEWAGVKRQMYSHAEELLAKVGLKERLQHLPRQLSGGERQRVAIARALINNPQIVLCDEPTGNLDEDNSRAIHELIWDLNKQLGQTFVIVTHEDALSQKGHRVFKLEQGRLRQIS